MHHDPKSKDNSEGARGNPDSLGLPSGALPPANTLDQDLPPQELFEEDQQKYLQEVKAYGGKWVARGSDGEVIVAVPLFEKLHSAVCDLTGSDSTPYTPQRIFLPSEFNSRE